MAIKSQSSREIISRLRSDNWLLARENKGHQQWRHPTKPGRVTLDHPRKDIPIGTLRSLYRQAGWKWPPED